MGDPMVAVATGLAYPDDLAQLRRELHDGLIVRNPRRLGPVRWVEFGTEDRQRLRELLEKAGVVPAEAQQYVNRAILHPGVVLCIAMVEVPGGRNGGS